MSRLKHYPKAYLKSLQMSRIDVFVFVEGKSDRYFYDRICETATAGTGLSHEVRTADELDLPSKGKAALLQFFCYLRRRRLLAHDFKGKKLCTVFFADKDVDDFLKRVKRSSHLVYTKYYHFENYLMRYTDLADVSAATASLDVNSMRNTLGDQERWRRRAADEWKDWVKLCITTIAADARCPEVTNQ
jgi:hypothetical protein